MSLQTVFQFSDKMFDPVILKDWKILILKLEIFGTFKRPKRNVFERYFGKPSHLRDLLVHTVFQISDKMFAYIIFKD